MRKSRLAGWGALVTLALTGCDCGGDRPDGGGGADALPGTDATTESDAGADAAGGSDGGTATDASAATDAGAGSDAATAAFNADVVSFDPWANCMPVVGPDPMLFAATIRYTNWDAASAATATVTDAELSILAGGAPPMVQTVTLTPADSGPIAPGSYADVMHAKVIGSGVPPLAVCTMCDNGVAFDAQLVVTFDVGGSTVVATSAVTPALCTF